MKSRHTDLVGRPLFECCLVFGTSLPPPLHLTPAISYACLHIALSVFAAYRLQVHGIYLNCVYVCGVMFAVFMV